MESFLNATTEMKLANLAKRRGGVFTTSQAKKQG
jgi:hypothetical protein